MPRSQRRAFRHLVIWIFQPILYILRVVYRLLKPLVRKIFRHLRSYLGRVLPTFRIVQTLMSYIEPWKPVILPIIGRLIFLIKRPFSLEINDDKELETVVYIEPRGLQNLGNTCYFNSMMQPLTYTNLLRELLLKSPTTGELTKSLRSFYTEMFSGESGSFSPSSLHQIFSRECSRFDNRNQHDSHECLRNFLDNIRKEERRQLKTTVSDNSQGMLKLTTVDKVFGGQLITVYICMRCRGPYHLFEPCLDLSLPICFERGPPEGRNRALSKNRKDIQAIAVGDGLKMGSELGKTSMNDVIMETREDEGEVKENIEEEEEEEEGEEEDEEKEKERKAEKKAEAKGKEEQIGLDDDEVGRYEEENYRKQRKDEMNNEKETREVEKDEEKEEDEESNRKKEADQNEAKMKKEPNLKEEHLDDYENEDALKQSDLSVLGKILDEEEKHEKEKLEDDEDIECKGNRDKRSKNSKKKFMETSQERGQSNSTLVNSDWKLQPESSDWEHSKQQAQNLNLSLYDDTVETESAIGAVPKSQQRSDVSRSNEGALTTSPQDEGRSQENDSYKAAIRSLMEPLSLRSATKLNNVDSKPKSVDECLMYFTREEHIRKEYLCRGCRDENPENNGIDIPLTSATKQTLIFSPPAVLTIHLKRFELKPGGSVKRNDMITYEELLDIAPYCSSMCLRNDPPCPNIWYSLYAVVVHSGSLDFGHYTAYVKVQRDEQLGSRRFLQTEFFDGDVTKKQLIEMVMKKERKSPTASKTGAVWYCANDSNIHKVTLEKVLKQEAYLLFYERL